MALVKSLVQRLNGVFVSRSDTAEANDYFQGYRLVNCKT